MVFLFYIFLELGNFFTYLIIVGSISTWANHRVVLQKIVHVPNMAKENETFGPSRKELRCDIKNYNFFFIFRIANNKLIDILEVEKNEKKIRFRFLID